jgi:hypothetical protein
VHNLIATLRRLGATINFSLCKLNEIQFSAPWNPARPRCGGTGL